MGATNDFYETNIGFQLLDKECQKCFRKFTQPEIDDRNFDVWFDTSNEVGLKPISEDENSFSFSEVGYQLTIWVRSIEHKDCPVGSETFRTPHFLQSHEK